MIKRMHVYADRFPLYYVPLLALLRRRMRLSRELSDDIVRARGGMNALYYSDRSLHAHMPYLDGMRHGTTRWFSTNGTVHGELYFEAGNRQGRTRWWWCDNTGFLQQESFYVDDQLHGTSRLYHSTGALSTELVYEHGKVISRNGVVVMTDDTQPTIAST